MHWRELQTFKIINVTAENRLIGEVKPYFLPDGRFILLVL